MQIDPSKVQWDEPAAPSAAPAPPPAIDVNAVKWDEPAAPKRSIAQDVGRQVGLTVRHAVNGVAALPAIAADAVAGVANKGLDVAMGDGKGFRFASNQAKALDNLLTKTGLPQPENAQERVVGDATAALAGTGGVVKAGQMLSQSAAPLVQAVGKGLAADSGLQAASSIGGSVASGVTREAGGGEGAQLAAGLVGALAPVALRPTRVPTTGGGQTRAAAKQANSQGYVIPPVELSPNSAVEALSGFSGKAKTTQVASARNQTVSNSLARKALGLSDDVDLNIDTLEALRKQAASAYAPVAAAGTVTPTKAFTDALDEAIKPFASQARSFPKRQIPSVVGDIEALKSPQFDAGDALDVLRLVRTSSDKAFRDGDKDAGRAYRMASNALEDALETHLQGLGQPGADMLKQFRDARQQIAKTWTVQNALNPSTGNINAIKLAADLAKNKPLSGELRSVAEFGQAFPKAAQALKEAPNATSPLDWVPATLTAVGTGNPLPMAAVGARPLVRSLLLSPAMQRKAVEKAGTEIKRIPEGATGIVASAIGRSGGAEPQPEQIFKNRIQAGYAARTSNGVVVPVDGGFVVRPR